LAHEQTPLSNDAIDSVLRHREVGRARNLSAPPRILVDGYVRFGGTHFLNLRCE